MRRANRTRSQAARAGITLAGIALGSIHAFAAIPEYQIVRIVAYNTSCQLEGLRSEDRGDAGLRFHATCRNINSFPDGLILDCPDGDDAFACKVVTEERRFHIMDSLRDQVDAGMP